MSLTHENVQWNDDYCIGESEIDRESKKLFKIAQQALKIEKFEKDNEIISAIKQIIDELSFYTSTHFVIEQKYMRTIQYPKVEQHTNLHKNIIKNLNNFISSLNSLSLDEVKKELFHLIKSNFIDHIIYEDQRIIKWESSLDSAEKTFDWSSAFELGEAKIDEENKKLFEMATHAFTQANQVQRDKKIRLLVQYLYHYAKEQFPYEEALMNEMGYHRLPQHLLNHKKIISQINHYVERLPTEKNMAGFEKGLASLIENTLVFHVMDQENHFREWYKENKI